MKRDRDEQSISLSQSGYIERILNKSNMKECHPNAIPADPNSLLYSEEINIECNAPYREAVGCSMFLAVVLRPDIMFAVSQASRFLSNPKKGAWECC
ncbi:hypothetical protein JTB14_015255 [Gonioctena quinquepunctata]|nr:hypothetical protein JTB14_015255 [Gonioctena quinquepunctata]